MQMPFEWNRRVACLKSKYERGDELELERLIAEVVAAEREACAKLAHSSMLYGTDGGLLPTQGEIDVAERIAAAIRNRT